MTDGINNPDNKTVLNQNVWEGFSNWFHSICVVTFDLELGQALEVIFIYNVYKYINININGDLFRIYIQEM